VARAVSSVGAPRNTLGMKLNTEWLAAVATRKREVSVPLRRGLAAAPGFKISRNPIQPSQVARSREPRLLTPGRKPLATIATIAPIRAYKAIDGVG